MNFPAAGARLSGLSGRWEIVGDRALAPENAQAKLDGRDIAHLPYAPPPAERWGGWGKLPFWANGSHPAAGGSCQLAQATGGARRIALQHQTAHMRVETDATTERLPCCPLPSEAGVGLKGFPS